MVVSVDVAVIGGTGVYDPAIISGPEEKSVATPYGEVVLMTGRYGEKLVAFLNRHGHGHTVPPHLVNYRANIAALKMLGAQRVLATAAVGSLNPEMRPGHFVFIDQFLDFTRTRRHTFFEGGPAGVVHTDMTSPYCSGLRTVLEGAARCLALPAHERGVYVCCEGPRFETAAEIKMFRLLGGDLVGMTNVPEASLAREAGLCYAAVALVTNFAAGISPQPLTHQEVLEVMAQNSGNVKKLLAEALAGAAGPAVSCDCPGAELPLEELLKNKS